MKASILFFTCLLFAFTCAGQDLTTGLVAYFPFDGNVNDISGNNNNGISTNVAYTTDRFNLLNKAIKFGGFNNRGYVRIPNTNSLKMTDQLTITVWMRLDDAAGMDGYGNLSSNGGYHSIICKDGDKEGWDFKVLGDKATNSFSANFSNNLLTSPPKIALQDKHLVTNSIGKWIHISYVIGNGIVKLFVNGTLEQIETGFTINFDRANASDLMIGNFGNNGGVNPYYWYPTNGGVDDARIYNRALSDSEVKQIYKIETPTAPTTNITAGLVAHYTFTGNANDASGNSNNGTVLGPTLTIDRHGNPNQAYSFDGVDDMVKINDSPSLRPNLITMTAWVNPSEAKRMRIFGKTNPLNAANEQYTCAFESNLSTSVDIKQNSGCSAGSGWQGVRTTQVFSLNQWNFVAYTFDGFSLSIFINGVLVAQKYNLPLTTIDNCVGGTLQIGYWWDGDKAAFKGKLDDLRIYDRALSHNDIVQLYLSEKPTTNIFNDLVGYYPFDANANDLSGFSNHGTPNGALLTTDRFGNANRAYAFDGNDFITVPNSPILQSIDSSITISGWAISTSQNHAIMCKSGNDLSVHFRLQSLSGGTISFINNNNYTNYVYNFIPNTWYHFAAVSNGKTYKIYLNGSQIYSSASQGSYTLNKTTSLEFGRDLHNIPEYHNGKLDELRIYKRALSDMEVLELYRADNNIISVQSGNWNDPNTWSCDCIPTFTDNVTIKTPHVIELSTGATGKCRTISTDIGAVLKIPNTSNFLANPKL